MSSSQRDVFPYRSDREVITLFLEGKANTQAGLSDSMTTDGKMLACAGHPVAHYDTGSSLVGVISTVLAYPYVVRVFNEILDQLGDKDTRVTREGGYLLDHNHMLETKWFLGDQPITLGVPFVMAGPLSMAAWRASRGVKIKKLR